MLPINVFISSSMRELEYDREIAEEVLSELNVEPVLFELLPAMSRSPSDSYLDAVRGCAIFVMILWKSLSPAVMEEYEEALRSNKPILIFVKSLVDNEEREDELKAFLTKLSSRSPDRVRPVVYRNYRGISQLRHAIRDSVKEEIAKFYKTPLSTLSREEMYNLGKDIIRSAQKRLYLYQKTPSMILGAREYLVDDLTKYAHEKEFVDTLKDWVDSKRAKADKEFLYLFSEEATRLEIEQEGLNEHPQIVEALKQRIVDLKNVGDETGHRFRIGFFDGPISGPLIVGDNRFGIWLLGGDDAVSISQDNEPICSVLVRMLRAHAQKSLSAEEIISKLGIG